MNSQVKLVSCMSLEDKAKEDEVFYITVGEFSTNDTLKHIHPEHIATISKQLWDKAKSIGYQQALKDMIKEAYKKSERCYTCGTAVNIIALEKIAEELS